MSLQLDGVLKPEQEQQLQAHLAECPSCRERWDTMSWLSSLLATEPLATPAPDLASKVTARLEKRAARRQRLYSGVAVCIGSVGLWTVAAVAVLLVAGIVVDPSMQTALARVLLSLGRNSLVVLTVLGKALWSVIRAVATRPTGLLVIGYGLAAVALAIFWTRLLFRRWEHVAR